MVEVDLELPAEDREGKGLDGEIPRGDEGAAEFAGAPRVEWASPANAHPVHALDEDPPPGVAALGADVDEGGLGQGGRGPPCSGGGADEAVAEEVGGGHTASIGMAVSVRVTGSHLRRVK
jgi:hypothetical protein